MGLGTWPRQRLVAGPRRRGRTWIHRRGRQTNVRVQRVHGAARWAGKGIGHVLHDELLATRNEERASLLVRPENTTAYRDTPDGAGARRPNCAPTCPCPAHGRPDTAPAGALENRKPEPRVLLLRGSLRQRERQGWHTRQFDALLVADDMHTELAHAGVSGDVPGVEGRADVIPQRAWSRLPDHPVVAVRFQDRHRCAERSIR